jgi:predicted acetyltransferase
MRITGITYFTLNLEAVLDKGICLICDSSIIGSKDVIINNGNIIDNDSKANTKKK